MSGVLTLSEGIWQSVRPDFHGNQLFEHHKPSISAGDRDIAAEPACAAWDVLEAMPPTTFQGWLAKFRAIANKETFPVDPDIMRRLCDELDGIDAAA
jgi:hypothetical protein